MKDIRAAVASRLFSAKRAFDIHKMRWKRRLGWLEPVIIIPYRGYGTPRQLSLRGRVVEEKEMELEQINAETSPWRNMVHMYRHFHSDEVPEARIRARFQDRVCETTSDAEGFFHIDIEPATPLARDQTWYAVELELLGPKARGQGDVRATGHVVVPPPDAEFGIISDMDDTVIHTGATTLFRQWRTILFNNAYTRRPFEGVDAFYTALQKGPDAQGHNPVFYVSSSAWNLYELFTSILDLHEIPTGPLLLRNYGLDRRKGINFSHKDHKFDQIKPILDTYPELPFVLIGDSGQKDPEIYRQIVDDYPGRIRAIYIRDVTSPRRDREVHAIADAVQSSGVALVLAEDSITAAQHAANHGLISHAALPGIAREKQRDEQRPRQPIHTQSGG